MMRCWLALVVVGDEILSRKKNLKGGCLPVWLLPIHQMVALVALSVVAVDMNECCLLEVSFGKPQWDPQELACN
jgi:hypothetical protein